MAQEKTYSLLLSFLLCFLSPPSLLPLSDSAGIYVLMFVHIFYTFCKAISLTLLLIFAFSFAFYMTFYDPSENFLVCSWSEKKKKKHEIRVNFTLFTAFLICYSWEIHRHHHDYDYRRF